MARIFPAKFRYPLFFAGFLLMELSGFLLKYLSLSSGYAEGFVILGFLLFLVSILAP